LATRLLALVAAVAMVVGAIVLRASWDDDDNGSGGQTGALRLVCATELEAACRQIADGENVDVVIEDAGVTADRLAKAQNADMDGWLTPGPWREILDAARGAQPTLFEPARVTPIAFSRVGFVMWNDRAAKLTSHCGGSVTWRCLGESAGRPWADVGGEPTWGTVRISLPDAETTASGVAVLGAGAAGYFGRVEVSTLDLDNDPGFGNWLSRLARANPGVDLERLLATGPSAAAAIGVVESTGEAALRSAAVSGRATLIYPAPVATVELEVSLRPGDRGRRLLDLVHARATAFQATGWDQDGTIGGLPSPGLMQALRTRWESIR
jgi:hypothetical protein